MRTEHISTQWASMSKEERTALIRSRPNQYTTDENRGQLDFYADAKWDDLPGGMQDKLEFNHQRRSGACGAA